MEDFQGNAEELFDLLRKEAELVYYQKKLAESEIDLDEFLRLYRERDREEVLNTFRVPSEDRLDWTKLFDPAKEVSSQDFPDFIQTYLKKDIAEAELGNQEGAIAAAIDTYKELQAPFNYMLDQGNFTPKEYYEDFFGTFNRNYSFLTIGAPVIRQKQLLALTKAGIVEFLAPEMVVERSEDSFLAYSKKNTSRIFKGENLIEARLPATSLKRTKNKVLINMREKGYLTSHSVTFEGKEHPTGAIKVVRKTHQLIDKNGDVLSNIYCYGIPLEGLDWLNAASPRPKSNDRVFYLANQIVQNIYR